MSALRTNNAPENEFRRWRQEELDASHRYKYAGILVVYKPTNHVVNFAYDRKTKSRPECARICLTVHCSRRGKYGVTGGRPELKEPPLTCAIREFEEEMGTKFLESKVDYAFTRTETSERGIVDVCHFFLYITADKEHFDSIRKSGVKKDKAGIPTDEMEIMGRLWPTIFFEKELSPKHQYYRQTEEYCTVGLFSQTGQLREEYKKTHYELLLLLLRSKVLTEADIANLSRRVQQLEEATDTNYHGQSLLANEEQWKKWTKSIMSDIV